MSRKPSPLAAAISGPKQETAAPAPQVVEPEAKQPEAPATSLPQAAAATDANTTAARANYVSPSRAGKTAKTFHLPPIYWETMEEVAFRTRDENGKRSTQERLMAEALNLLFQKYNYPVVRE